MIPNIIIYHYNSFKHQSFVFTQKFIWDCNVYSSQRKKKEKYASFDSIDNENKQQTTKNRDLVFSSLTRPIKL